MERIRFGVFDFDSATGELRREGAPVRLQAQPAQVLGLLLAGRGEVVTRESLRAAIWGNDTFVDFDRGLNFRISQIRGALGDSADSPRFIRTVPKRGYQFIAPLPEPAAPAPAMPAVRAPRLVSGRRLAAAGAVVVAGGLLVAALYKGGAFGLTTPADAPSIAVARFDNETGNADFDRFSDGVTDAVIAELTNRTAPRFSVIGNAAILRRPREQRDLTEIATSLKAQYVILGQVQQSGTRVRVTAHLIRLPDQKHLTVTRFETAVDDPLAAQTKFADRIVRDFVLKLALPAAANN